MLNLTITQNPDYNILLRIILLKIISQVVTYYSKNTFLQIK